MRLSVHALVVILFTFFVGCVTGSSSPPKLSLVQKQKPVLSGRVLIDADFSGPEQALIKRAVGMWVSGLNGALELQISDHSGDEFVELQQTIMLQRAAVMAGMVERGEEPVDPVEAEDDPTKLLDIMRSQEYWTGKYCTNRVVIIRASSQTPRIKEAEQSGVAFAGWTYTGCWKKFILIVGSRMDSEDEMVSTVAHELGHAFGLLHQFDGDKSVMHNDSHAAKCVLRTDLEAFCKRWKCDPKSLNPVAECHK